MSRHKDMEKIEKLALGLEPDELKALVKRLTSKIEGKVVLVLPNPTLQHARIRRVVVKTTAKRIASRQVGDALRVYSDEYYPTLDELRALPPEERNRRVRLALSRTHTQIHDDLEGYTDADFDDGTDPE